MSITLKALRINAGLDQKKAAQVLGITPETLSNWERGKSFPTVPQITAIENLYNTTYSEINFLPTNIALSEEGVEQ